MPHQHYLFHSTCLSFLPVTTVDSSGRPWGSILVGKEARLEGWIQATYRTISINAHVWNGDPILTNLKEGRERLVAGIGIQLSTRRRNKFAGKITSFQIDSKSDDQTKIAKEKEEGKKTDIRIDLTVNQALGNCPKYITIRELDVYEDIAKARIVYDFPNLHSDTSLPDEIISFIHASDTVFLGSTYSASPADAELYPSHVGMNHRGGRPGFVRASGRNVYIPDYSGNRFMTTLGNIETTPLASLTIIDYSTGDVLYLTGDATNHFGKSAREIMPLQNALTCISVTGYVFVKDAFPFRQKAQIEPSPYSPPIRYLASETSKTLFSDGKSTALLRRIELHSDSIATLTWGVEGGIKIIPGQAVILDLSTLLGQKNYRHMNSGKPSEVNDDRIRTWTVSSSASSVGNSTKEFSITIKLKPTGLITPALFAIANQMKQVKPELLDDSRPVGMSVGIVGVSGDFVLPEHDSEGKRKMVWIAGGIGVTPFLSMLKSLSRRGEEKWDIILLLSTREPEVFLPILASSLVSNSTNLSLSIRVYSSNDIPITNMDAQRYSGRINGKALDEIDELVKRDVYVCGPGEFESAIVRLLEARGVKGDSVKREGFVY
ncbi:hypothetical protein BDQ17DRAFT_1333457 [Cyathus striatus]|nr:hypothetical protein BDQ17DRAFT_1333457 [Cyathus striatus]